MTQLSRRQLLATASGIGAAAVLSATATSAAENPSTPVSDVPLNVGGLERVTPTLVPPPFLPDHDQIALGGPKVVQVRLVIEEKTMVLDDEGTEVMAMTFNGSVPGPMIGHLEK